jgi:hypothetical protein
MTLVAASPGQSAPASARRQALVDTLKDNAAKLQKAADKEITTARKVSEASHFQFKLCNSLSLSGSCYVTTRALHHSSAVYN